MLYWPDMIRTTLRLALTASILFLAGTGSAQDFRVGEPFPDLAFPSAADGTPVSIADFRGHKVVLHVFASW
jgi:hypothetical protein